MSKKRDAVRRKRVKAKDLPRPPQGSFPVIPIERVCELLAGIKPVT